MLRLYLNKNKYIYKYKQLHFIILNWYSVLNIKIAENIWKYYYFGNKFWIRYENSVHTWTEMDLSENSNALNNIVVV